MNLKLISIVIPCYNVEKYIEKCIYSIIGQDYNNFEIILVDDGSTDETLELITKLSYLDDRIKVIHQDNKGRSIARNKGIALSKGEYITFVDSDDYVAPTYLSDLMFGINKGADISMVNKILVQEGGGNKNSKINRSGDYHIYNTRDGIKAVLLQKPDNEIWGKIYRSELLTSESFPRGKIFEDLFATLYIMSKAKTIIHYEVEDYYYVQREDNTINSKFTKNKMDILDMGKKISTYIIQIYPDLKVPMMSKLFSAYTNVWMQIDKNKYKDEYNVLWKEIKKVRSRMLFKKLESVKLYGGVILSFFGDTVYRYCYSKIRGK
ncbi:glycosyltransferase [Latilactobacillus sakei]|uniref:glycosyltransferase n=1 Tax=Latilactobacillus sakei TaxID=1599 RepID=UPI003CF50A4C